MSSRIDVYLVAGGKYHDINFARLELLKLLAEHEDIRVEVGPDYSRIAEIEAADVLITYTCDVVPTAEQQAGLRRFLAKGGKWFALHGTNSIIRFLEDGRIDCPDLDGDLSDMLGSQFRAHPPICRYEIQVTDSTHPLTRGLKNFWVEDELYLGSVSPGNHTLLHTRWGGNCAPFVQEDWPEADHPVMYLRDHGPGQVLYLVLGHCRGKHDLRPLMEEYPHNERCSWQSPVFYELLRRGIRWSMKRGAVDGAAF